MILLALYKRSLKNRIKNSPEIPDIHKEDLSQLSDKELNKRIDLDLNGVFDEVGNINSFYNEAYDDFHNRFADAPTVKQELLQAMDQETKAGIDKKEILKKYLWQ